MANIMLQSIRNDKKYELSGKCSMSHKVIFNGSGYRKLYEKNASSYLPVTFVGLVKKGIVKSRQAW